MEGSDPSENTDEMPQNSNWTKLPMNQTEAISDGVKILREMEFRSVRGAMMAYNQSYEYETKHFWLTCGMTIATAVLSVKVKDFIPILRDALTSTTHHKLYTFLYAAVFGCIVYCSGCPEYMIPLYKVNFEKHNKAGAGWQKLEFKIRSFLATQIQNDTSPAEIRDFINEVAEERRIVCEIARPERQMRKKYVENPALIKQYKDDLEEGLKHYFRFNGNERTDDKQQTLWERIKSWFSNIV